MINYPPIGIVRYVYMYYAYTLLPISLNFVIFLDLIISGYNSWEFLTGFFVMF